MEKPAGAAARDPLTERVLATISNILAIVASFALFVMMALIVVDVVGRYFFNSPLSGAIELVGLLLIVAATFGLGYCQMRRAHIRITIIFERFSRTGKYILEMLAYICGIGASFLVCWQTYLRSVTYLKMSQGNITEILGIPLFPFLLMLALGFGWMCVIFIRDFCRILIRRSVE
jgi:TRAP-type C4-dicarboxylate transport system permease small subunit